MFSLSPHIALYVKDCFLLTILVVPLLSSSFFSHNSLDTIPSGRFFTACFTALIHNERLLLQLGIVYKHNTG